jgi:hypothetical protein
VEREGSGRKNDGNGLSNFLDHAYSITRRLDECQ